jgi:hypothetical protein
MQFVTVVKPFDFEIDFGERDTAVLFGGARAKESQSEED